MPIQDRLRMIIKMNDLTASSFADRVGVQRSSVSHILSGRNKPSLDFIQKTIKEFPRVNGDWLVTGRSEVSAAKAPNITDKSVAQEKKPVLTEQAPLKSIAKIIVFYTDGSYEETVKVSD